MAKNDSTPKPFEIQLTKGYVAIVDVQDYDLDDFNWSALVASPNCVYAQRQVWVAGKPKCILMHRVILGRKLGRELDTDEFCDHIHGNTLDNRRTELRLATRSQNTINTGMNARNTSGYKGIWFDKQRNKWRAQIAYDKKKVYLGRFDTPEEAHAAYLEAAKQYHAEYARLSHASYDALPALEVRS